MNSAQQAQSAPVPAPQDASRAQAWLFALSLANLAYVKTWAALLESGRNVTPLAYAVAIANILLLTVVFRAIATAGEKSRGRAMKFIVHAGGAAVALLIAHAISTIYFADAVLERNLTYLAGALVGAALLFSSRARHAAAALVMIASPFVAVTFGQAIHRAVSYDANAWNPPVLPAGTSGRPTRLVWLLFDEWDYGLTFDNNTRKLMLPTLQELIGQSFHASNAHPPGDVTARSVPRLLTGERNVNKDTMAGHPNVFAKAKALGARSAVGSWYLPYCGVFKDALSACWSPNASAERSSMGNSAVEISLNQLRNLAENQFRSPFGQPLAAKRHALDYEYQLKTATTAVADPALDFVYVHFPVPHEPLFYDHRSGRYDLGERPVVSMLQKNFEAYYDAVQLVDRTIGSVRGSLQQAGLWDRTHLIVTSDHNYRNRHRLGMKHGDTRVPFIVRVAGSTSETAFDQKFNTILSADLAIALLAG